MNSVFELKLEAGPVPVIIYALSLLVFLVLATKRPVRRWLPLQFLGAAIGVGLGYLLGWLVSDVWNSFGVSLTPITRLWFGVAVGAIGFAIAGLFRSRPWRKVVAIFSVALFALMGSVGVNIDIAEFPTLGAALGVNAIHRLALPSAAGGSPDTGVVAGSPGRPASTVVTSLASHWHAPAGMPKTGTVGSVTIPATVSHFSARQAIVYLPPAALVRNPPRLPVLEMLSGQPGMPSNLITSGALATILDSYAAQHEGLAPIVVIPDQLGAPQLNPMCVDSPLGNAATYLTVDVPTWIRSHLHVLPGRQAWAIGGFSEGGTCSIQLGAKYADLYGNILDISGELAPHRGTIPATIKAAFGGDTARYSAATPVALLAAGTPFRDTLAIFAVGQDDTRFGPGSVTVSKAATVAGMSVHYVTSPGTAHDWHTVQFAIRQALPLLYTRWGL